MTQVIRKYSSLLGAALLLLLLATSAFAVPPPTTVTFDLTGVGPTGANLAGVYTSPYTGTVNGVSGLSVICDDYADDSFTPEDWTAYVTSLSSLNSPTPAPSPTANSEDGTLKWGNTSADAVSGIACASGDPCSIPALYQYQWNLSQAAAYDAAALLSIDLLNPSSLNAISTTCSYTNQQAYSFALWELFDANASFSQLTGSGDSCVEQQALTDLQSAVSAVNTQSALNSTIAYLNNYNVNIYSYDSGATCPDQPQGKCQSIPPQEFITVSMAEPSSFAMLGVDMLGVAGLILFVRRRTSRQRTLVRL